MKQQIDTIEELWSASHRRLGLETTSDVQQKEMRKAFYAAAGSLLIKCRDDISMLPEDEGAVALQNWLDEINLFWKREVDNWRQNQ